MYALHGLMGFAIQWGERGIGEKGGNRGKGIGERGGGDRGKGRGIGERGRGKGRQSPNVNTCNSDESG